MLIKDCVFADGVSVADIEVSSNLYLANSDSPLSDYAFVSQRCGEYGCETRLVVLHARVYYPLNEVYTTRKAALVARHNIIKLQAATIKSLIDKEP